jgi:membrane associated rhomboid family serine protease
LIPLHDDNPTELFPYVTVAFIVACVMVFLWQFSLGPQGQQFILVAFGFIPAVVLQGQTLPNELQLIPPTATVFTSMFLHGGWMHLIGNMLYLWIFGNNVEDAMGHKRFLVFYLVCGIAAAMAQAIPNPGSTIPMVGASGAISGVLGAYLLLHPKARVLVVLPLVFIWYSTRLRAMYVLAFWFVLQIVNSVMTAASGGGGVAWGAHIGGFVAGMALIPLFKYRKVRLFS